MKSQKAKTSEKEVKHNEVRKFTLKFNIKYFAISVTAL